MMGTLAVKRLSKAPEFTIINSGNHTLADRKIIELHENNITITKNK